MAIVFAVVWGLITHGTFAGSGDEPHYLMIAHSLAFDADLDLTNNYRDATLIGGGELAPGAHAIERTGRLRPVHDVGMPLVLAPVVGIAYHMAEALADILPANVLQRARLNASLVLRHQISLAMALLTGFLAREMFLSLRDLGGAPRSAFALALLFALTPPVLSHSFLFFTEIPSALATLLVFRRLSLRPVQTTTAALVAGAVAGLLLVIHARNAGIVCGLGLVAIIAAHRRTVSVRLVMLFLAAAATGALGRAVITYTLWGQWLTTPHAAFGSSASVAAMAQEMFVRATGLLFDREYGLFAYGPIYLLALPGLFILARRWPRPFQDVCIVSACYLLLVLLPLTNIHGWTGGWSPAARFLVPIAPLVWLGVYAYGHAAGRFGRILLGVLVGLQVAVDGFVWQFPKTLWNEGDGVSTVSWAHWLPSWTDSSAMPAFVLALCGAGAFTYLTWRYAAPAE